MRSSLPPLLALFILLPLPAPAEQFQLASGGRLVGRLLNRDEAPRRQYVIQLPDGTQLTLPKDAVTKVVRRSAALEEYLRLRPQYADSVAGQWDLAEWCRQHKLATPRETHLRRILELEPDHADARRALGYSQVDGQWKTQEEIMTERGYVRSGGTWKLPQEIEVTERNRKVRLAEQEWQKSLHRWRQWLTDPDHAAEATQRIRSIDDPFATKALAKFLADDPSEAERQLVLEALANIHTPQSAELLAGLALHDPADEIRASALEQLARDKPTGVAKFFIRQLRNPDNLIVNRAGYALGMLGDRQAVPALIDALVTTHKFKVTQGSPGGGTNATFARPDSNGVINNPVYPGQTGGLGSFSTGSSTVIVSERLRNADVLEALIKLTERNDDYDVRSWKLWYASQKKSEGLDARRDES